MIKSYENMFNIIISIQQRRFGIVKLGTRFIKLGNH